MNSFAKILLIFCSLTVFLSGCNPKPVQNQNDITSEIAKEDKYPGWFREAKFGMFIHWGPYSRLAGEWNGRQVPVGRNAEWIMKELQMPVDEYRQMAKEFNPVEFDARKLVELAISTGMKYIVITAKHHDGFAMYKSGVTQYNIYDWTKFNRDPLKELAEACREGGIKFCVYYSHREDWDHPGGYGNNWDYDNDWGSDLYDPVKFNTYLEEKAKPQLRELLTNYGPVGLVWFDRGMYTREQGLEFVRLVKDIQPGTLINGRVGHYNQEFIGDYQSMSDNGMPPGGLEEYWETPQTLNETWGFSKFDTMWKSHETIILRLAEVVSRGGNFLLNIGPEGSGEIPDTTIKIFDKVGKWMKRNSESIYGTSANPFGELPWGYSTVKGGKVYLLVREWPQEGRLTVSRLLSRVKSAYPLSDRSVLLTVNQSNNLTYIDLPATPADTPVSVIVLEIEGDLKVAAQVVEQDTNGEIFLNYLTASTKGNAITRYNRKGGFHISKWTCTEDAVEWIININHPGKFKISLEYSAIDAWQGKIYEIKVGNHSINKQVISTKGLFDYNEFPAGYIDLFQSGQYNLKINPAANDTTYLMYLKNIKLTPVERIKRKGWGN